MQTQTESVFPPRKTAITATPVASLVDELGEIKASAAQLAKRETEIIELLKKKGVSVYQGKLFEANIFESSRSSLDVKALIAKHPKLAPTISKFTKTTPMLVCKVQAKVQR